MRILGIEFASPFIPLERRLQTLAVAQWFFIFLVAPLISLFLVISSIFTILMPFTIAYLLWLYFYDLKTPKKGGRRSDWFRRLKIWTYFKDYFPISLVKTEDLNPSQNYLLGYHPHGILVCSAFCNFCTEATGFSKLYPGIRPTMLTLVTNFYFPFFRGYLMALGACDVSRESLEYLLTKNGTGNAVVVVVGGAEEALDAHPDIYRLTLKSRKGFVKMAIKTGAHLVPCFGFHENEIFKQVANPTGSKLRKIQGLWKKMFGVSPPLFYGRGMFNYTFGLMPFRKPLVTVVGKPLAVIKDDNPSEETLNRVHQEYLKALIRLFEENKLNYGITEDKHLEFV